MENTELVDLLFKSFLILAFVAVAAFVYFLFRMRPKRIRDLPSSHTEDTVAELRQHPRADIIWPVVIETSSGTIETKLCNISCGGAFVLCEKPLQLREQFSLRIEPAENEHLMLTAEVVWSNTNVPDDKVINRGMGIRFIKVSEEDRRRLDAAISTHLSDQSTEGQ